MFGSYSTIRQNLYSQTAVLIASVDLLSHRRHLSPFTAAKGIKGVPVVRITFVYTYINALLQLRNKAPVSHLEWTLKRNYRIRARLTASRKNVSDKKIEDCVKFSFVSSLFLLSYHYQRSIIIMHHKMTTLNFSVS